MNPFTHARLRIPRYIAWITLVLWLCIELPAIGWSLLIITTLAAAEWFFTFGNK